MLPTFPYHPDPVATGNVKSGVSVCPCCGQSRGHVYTASVHSRELPRDSLCPWCIADGSAAQKFDAMFSDDHPLLEAGVPEAVIEEVTRRTPGYNSWQQEVWQTCCNDACAFHGDASKEELLSLNGELLSKTLTEWECRETDWQRLLQHYQPGSSPSVYKFVCLHCGIPKYALDFT